MQNAAIAPSIRRTAWSHGPWNSGGKRPCAPGGTLMARVVAWRQEAHTAAKIADCLNREGFSPPKRCDVFSPELVHKLLSRHEVRTRITYDAQLGPHEWWLPKLADQIPVPAGKL